MWIRIGHLRATAAIALIVTVAALSLGAGISEAGAETSKFEHISLKLVKRTKLKHHGLKFRHKGRASGSIAGRVTATSKLLSRVVLSGTVTIATSRGKVRIKIEARGQGLGRRSPFTGIATILSGTGRYARARGVAQFDAIVNRATWAITIDTLTAFRY
jgi:hypothetical protein